MPERRLQARTEGQSDHRAPLRRPFCDCQSQLPDSVEDLGALDWAMVCEVCREEDPEKTRGRVEQRGFEAVLPLAGAINYFRAHLFARILRLREIH